MTTVKISNPTSGLAINIGDDLIGFVQGMKLRAELSFSLSVDHLSLTPSADGTAFGKRQLTAKGEPSKATHPWRWQCHRGEFADVERFGTVECKAVVLREGDRVTGLLFSLPKVRPAAIVPAPRTTAPAPAPADFDQIRAELLQDIENRAAERWYSEQRPEVRASVNAVVRTRGGRAFE